MEHEYYSYTKEELQFSPKIPLLILKDDEAVFRSIAREMADEIIRKNSRNEHTVFICPVGPTGQYQYFAEIVNSEKISLKNVWFINMDEYLADDLHYIDINHPLSFHGQMQRMVYNKIDPDLLMPLDQRVFPDPFCIGRIPELIGELGGVDICFGGIGINGHVAFNEPDTGLSNEEFMSQKTRIRRISPETRTANAIGDYGGDLEDMPHFCITIGISEISESRKIRLGCFRSWHRAVVRRALYGEPTSAFPVTLLQNHPDICLRISEHVACLKD